MRQRGAKARATVSTGAIDLLHLNEATFRQRALAREVLTLFDRQAESLMHSIASTDPRTRAEAAHALRGAALGVGARYVASAAHSLELAADEQAVNAALVRLTARVAEARLAIAEILASR
jgi:HPt (histidine-containing phosphotransfer) domain-containing protein